MPRTAHLLGPLALAVACQGFLLNAGGSSEAGNVAAELAQAKSELEATKDELSAEHKKHVGAQKSLLQRRNGIQRTESKMADIEKVNSQMAAKGAKSDKILADTFSMLRGPLAKEAAAKGLPPPTSVQAELASEEAKAEAREANSLQKRLRTAEGTVEDQKSRLAADEKALEESTHELKETKNNVFEQEAMVTSLRRQVDEIEAQKVKLANSDELQRYSKFSKSYALEIDNVKKEIESKKLELSALKADKYHLEEEAMALKVKEESYHDKEAMRENQEAQLGNLQVEVQKLSADIAAGLALAEEEPGTNATVQDDKDADVVPRMMRLEASKQRQIEEASVNIKAVDEELKAEKGFLRDLQAREAKEKKEDDEKIEVERSNRNVQLQSAQDTLVQLPEVLAGKFRVKARARQEKVNSTMQMLLKKRSDFELKQQADLASSSQQLTAEVQSKKMELAALKRNHESLLAINTQEEDKLRSELSSLTSEESKALADYVKKSEDTEKRFRSESTAAGLEKRESAAKAKLRQEETYIMEQESAAAKKLKEMPAIQAKITSDREELKELRREKAKIELNDRNAIRIEVKKFRQEAKETMAKETAKFEDEKAQMEKQLENTKEQLAGHRALLEKKLAEAETDEGDKLQKRRASLQKKVAALKAEEDNEAKVLEDRDATLKGIGAAQNQEKTTARAAAESLSMLKKLDQEQNKKHEMKQEQDKNQEQEQIENHEKKQVEKSHKKQDKKQDKQRDTTRNKKLDKKRVEKQDKKQVEKSHKKQDKKQVKKLAQKHDGKQDKQQDKKLDKNRVEKQDKK